MTLDRSQREHLADKLMDSANFILITLVIGQFVERSIRWQLVLAGGVAYVTLLVLTTWLRKRR